MRHETPISRLPPTPGESASLFEEVAPVRATANESFAERRERIRAQFDDAVELIREKIIGAGHTPRVAFSSGKDSLTTLVIACEAMRQARDRGYELPTLHVTSANTGVENPEVVGLIRRNHEAVRQWGAREGIPVAPKIVEPPLSARMWVQTVGGRSLPAHRALNRSSCSSDWKVRPSLRHTREIDRALATQGKPPSVSLIGTRFEESHRRSQRMRERGESASAIKTGKTDGYEYLTLSPIADWRQDEVFAFLQDIGDGHFPSFQSNHQDTLQLYNDGAGASCILVPDPSQLSRNKGGGAVTPAFRSIKTKACATYYSSLNINTCAPSLNCAITSMR